MTIDQRTVFLIYTVSGIVCLAVLATLWRQNRSRYPWLRFLVADLLLQVVGMLLIALRGNVPGWLSIVVSNCVLATAFALGLVGLRLLLRRPKHHWYDYAVVAAFAFVQIYFTYAEPRLDVRIVNTSAVQLIFFAQCLWLIVGPARKETRRPSRILGAVFSAYCLVALTRIAAVVSGQYTESDYMHASQFETYSIVAWDVLLILFTYGLILTVNDLLSSQLRAQEQKFSIAFRSAPNSLLLTRLDDGKIVEVNDAFREVTGFSPEETIGKTTLAMGLWAKEEDRQTMFEEIQASGSVRQREYLYRGKSGRLFTGLLSAGVISLDGEDYLLAHVADIEERKKAENELVKQQKQNQILVERLDQAQSMARIGSWEMDLATGEVWWSREIHELFGVSDKTYVPSFEATQEHIHPDDRDTFALCFTDSMRTQAPFETVLRLVRTDGQILHGLAKGMVFCDESGAPARFAGLVMDITDRVLAEERLRESQEQLLQSQKMEAVGQLAGGIAHDFNNLLGVILGYTELALGDSDMGAGDPRPHLEHVKGAAERASALTKQILAFSRRQTLRPVVLSLNEIVLAIDPLLERTLGEDIDLVTILDPELASVEADPHQLEQVLMNLAVNSRDAMPCGGTLTIRTSNLDNDCRSAADESAIEALGRTDLVVLDVSDDGIGMDADTVARVFEPFFSTKDPAMGTGLGMSVVYGVVKQSRGHIEIESEPGSGTSTRIYLPRSETTAQPADLPVERPIELEGKETILVVEDEAALRELVKQFLRGSGYRVVSASAAIEALALADDPDFVFDALLTDVVLPGALQGSDLTKALEQTRPDLAVLYMSGYPRDAIVRAGRLSEGVSLIEKPFTREQLALALRTLLDKHRNKAGS